MDLGFRGRWVFEFGGQPAVVRQFHLVLGNMRPCLKNKRKQKTQRYVYWVCLQQNENWFHEGTKLVVGGEKSLILI